MPARRGKHRAGATRTSQRRRNHRRRQHQPPKYKTGNQARDQTAGRGDNTENEHLDGNEAASQPTDGVNRKLVNRNHRHNRSNHASDDNHCKDRG
jgi:hypothetical protein